MIRVYFSLTVWAFAVEVISRVSGVLGLDALAAVQATLLGAGVVSGKIFVTVYIKLSALKTMIFDNFRCTVYMIID